MPRIAPLIAHTAEKPESIENEKLFLPSDLTVEERLKFGVCALGCEEIMLRQAQAEQEISKVKTVAKAISTMLHFRSKSIRSQGPKTRSEHDVANTFVKRDRHIVAYNHARKALIRLGAFNPDDTNCPYPELKPEHTHRVNVDIKRRTGDSKRREGLLWTIGAASDLLAGVEPGDDLPVGLDENLVPIVLVTPTKMTQRKSGTYLLVESSRVTKLNHLAPAGPRKKKTKQAVESTTSNFIVGLDEDLKAVDAEDSDADDNGGGSENAHEKRTRKKEKSTFNFHYVFSL